MPTAHCPQPLIIPLSLGLIDCPTVNENLCPLPTAHCPQPLIIP